MPRWTTSEDRTNAVSSTLQPIPVSLGAYHDKHTLSIVGAHTTLITVAQQDAPSTLISQARLHRGSTDLINLPGQDLFLLLALIGGRSPTQVNTLADAGAFATEWPVDFTAGELEVSAKSPGFFLDTTDGLPVHWTFSTTTAALGLGTSATALQGSPVIRIDQSVTDPEIPAGSGVYEPFWTNFRADTITQALNAATVRLPRNFLLRGLLLRVNDSSAGVNVQRVDGLLRRAVVKANNVTLADRRFKAMRESYRQAAGLAAETPASTLAQVYDGIGWIDLSTAAHPYGLRNIGSDVELLLELDTSTGVDNDVTAVTAAAGDSVSVTCMGYRPSAAMQRSAR